MELLGVLFLCIVSVASTSPVKDTVGDNQTADTFVPQLVIPSISNTVCSKAQYHFSIRDMTCGCVTNVPQAHKRDDYQYTPGLGAHKFHTRSKTFNEARKICNEEGGHLAVINSDAEERILLDLAKRTGAPKDISYGGEAFIGVHDLFAEGEWVTIFNDSIYKAGYCKWFVNQPDNTGGAENCGALVLRDSAGTINDLPCTYKQPFFCEIPDRSIF